MTLQEFRELSIGDTVFLDGIIDGKQFRKQWAVVTDIDRYSSNHNEDDEDELALLVNYDHDEDGCDWWIGEEYHPHVFIKPRRSGLTKFLEATS